MSAAARLVARLEGDLKKLKKDGPVRETAMAVHDDSEIGDTEIRVRGVQTDMRGELPTTASWHVTP